MLAEYGVGRGSLREALRVLEVNGLISVKAGPGGGPVVAGVDSHAFGSMATLYFQVGGMTFGELVEARLVMEPVMARLAAERRDPELIAELGRALSEAEAADLGDGAEYLSVSIDFHEHRRRHVGEPDPEPVRDRAPRNLPRPRRQRAAVPRLSP